MDFATTTNDPQRDSHFRRSLIAAGVMVGLTVLCWICLDLGLLRLDVQGFLKLFAVLWLGNIGFLIVVISGSIRRLRFSGWILSQILWVGAGTMIAVYYLDDMRYVALMLFLVVMILGALELTFRHALATTAVASLGYALVIALLIQNHPESIRFAEEIIVWVAFSAVMLGSLLVGKEMSDLRTALIRHNQDLEILLDRLHEQAITDELTGIYNRRHMMTILSQQKSMADRGHYTFSVCFCDIDHFKKVNDTLGHAAGDRVLQNFCQIVEQHIRDNDFVGRFGGEEFVLIMSMAGQEHARQMADRLRIFLEHAQLLDTAPELRLTTSFGVTEYQVDESIERLLSRVDEALYKAKELGRNRVVVV